MSEGGAMADSEGASDERGQGAIHSGRGRDQSPRRTHSPTASRNRNHLSIAVPAASTSPPSTMLSSAGLASETASNGLKTGLSPSSSSQTGTANPATVKSIQPSNHRGIGLGLSRLSNEDLAALNEQRQRTMASLEGNNLDHRRVESSLSAATSSSSSAGNSDYHYAMNAATGTAIALDDPRFSLLSTATGQTSEDSHALGRSAVNRSSVPGVPLSEMLQAKQTNLQTSQRDLPALPGSTDNTSPRSSGVSSPAEGRETFVTTATGAVGRYGDTGLGHPGQEQQPQKQNLSASISSSANPNRRSFFSSLLGRSSSFTGQPGSSSLSRSVSQSSSSALPPPSAQQQQQYPHRSSPAPSSPSRASTSTLPLPSGSPGSRRRTFSQGHSHTHGRHSSNPVPPSPTMLGPSSSPSRRSMATQSPRTMTSSSSVGAVSGLGGGAGYVPVAHDGVFSSGTSAGTAGTGGRGWTATVSANSNASSSGSGTTPSRASRILRSHFTSSSSSSSSTPRPDVDYHPNQFTRTMSRSTTADSLSSLVSTTVNQVPPANLETLGLSLAPLSPSLNVGRYGQPLCGAVLDGKYLLIGTSLGLDFLPLNRPGNKSLKSGFLQQFSSSANSSSWNNFEGGGADGAGGGVGGEYGKDARIRKPIPLIKKTRFKQLVVLAERSNVLLAVAGRNDHVRVYALDSLRAVIEKKIREIDEKESSPSMGGGAFGGRDGQMRGLGVFMNGGSGSGSAKGIPPVPQVPAGLLKGKGRAIPPSPLLGSSSTMMPSTSSSAAGVEEPELSPPPAYSFPSEASSSSLSSTASMSTSSSSTSIYATATSARSSNSPAPSVLPGRRRSSASSGPPTPRFTNSSRVRSRSSLHTTSGNTSQSVPSSPRTSPGLGFSRHRSRETIRRPSSAGLGASSSGLGSGAASAGGSMSRRGSAATVTPSTVAALAAASGASAFLGPGGRRRSATTISSRRGSSTPTGLMESGFGQLTPGGRQSGEGGARSPAAAVDEEEYQWIDAPESPTTPLLTPLEEGSGSNALAEGRRASRMVPRSAVARDEDVSEQEEEHIVEDGRQPEMAATGGVQNGNTSPVIQEQQQKRANRRLSLADILKESRVAPPAPSIASAGTSGSRPSSPTISLHQPQQTMMMQRSTFTGILSTLSSGSQRKQQPRSATSSSGRDEMAYLAEFFRAGPPSPANHNAVHSAPLLQRTFTSTSADTQANRPTMLRSASSRGTLSSTQTITATTATRPKMQPRSPTAQKTEEDEDGMDSFMDLMRAGPPGLPGFGSSSSMTPSSSEDSAEAAKKLRKAGKNELATSPAMTRSPAMPSIAAAPVPAQVGAEERVSSIPIRERATSTRSEGAIRSQHGRRVASGTLPSANSAISLGLSKAQKRMSYQPRSPTFSHSTRGGADQVGGENMPRSMSLQEMLTVEPPSPVSVSQAPAAAVVGAGPSAPGLQRTNTQGSAGSNTLVARNEATTPGGRKKKRWSLLEGLRGGSNPVSPNPAAVSSSGMVASRSSTSLTGSSKANSPVVDRNNGSTFPSHASSASVASTASLTQVPEHTIPPSATSSSPAIASNPPILKPRPGIPLEEDSPPFGNLTPEIEQQALLAAQANNPEGTTVTFTQTAVTSSSTSASASNGNGRSSNAAGAGAVGGMSREATYQAMAGNLEYVKLARTKGARFIRASETSKRTYLAVLCGEQGERIELFTGSKNVSLSLNRTFVLPETPRTIEFQLQGEDLLDLYLIYDSAIFALEPSTVRVREVGIQRNERRAARRERERAVRETAMLDNTTPSAATGRGTPSPQHPHETETVEENAPTRSRVPTPLDVESARMSQQDSQDELPPPPLTPLEPNVPVPVPATSEDTAAPVRTSLSSEAALASAAMATDSSSDGAIAGVGGPATGTDSTGKTIPYSMFQQLEYLPPVPPSVLSSSYIIPPTYETVLSASPMPNQEAFRALSPDIGAAAGGRAASPALNMLSTETFVNANSTAEDGNGTPLLSPVSLLANPSARNTGPPGLFFVSKGKNTTSIVDGDGRSVMKKAIAWTENESATSLAEQAAGLENFTRLDIILTSSKTRVCLAAFGPTSARVIELGGNCEHSLEVIPPEAYKRRMKSNASIASAASAGKDVNPEDSFVRDVTYLAKSGEATYFAERVGSGVMIHALGAIGFSVPQ